jgi:hypothetical protein
MAAAAVRMTTKAAADGEAEGNNHESVVASLISVHASWARFQKELETTKLPQDTVHVMRLLDVMTSKTTVSFAGHPVDLPCEDEADKKICKGWSIDAIDQTKVAKAFIQDIERALQLPDIEAYHLLLLGCNSALLAEQVKKRVASPKLHIVYTIDEFDGGSLPLVTLAYSHASYLGLSGSLSEHEKHATKFLQEWAKTHPEMDSNGKVSANLYQKIKWI